MCVGCGYNYRRHISLLFPFRRMVYCDQFSVKGGIVKLGDWPLPNVAQHSKMYDYCEILFTRSRVPVTIEHVKPSLFLC